MIVLSVSVSTDFKLVRKEHIPHPISTPTALGTTASFEASTAPIGMPYPRCASGMMAIWWKANGRFARSFACERAPSTILPRSEEHTSELQSRGHLAGRRPPEEKNTRPHVALGSA